MESITRNVKFLRGLFSIILIATLMTVFELVFYVYIVAPTADGAVRTMLSNFKRPIPDNPINTEVDNLFTVMIKRDKKTLSEINKSSYIIIGMEIVAMFLFLSYLYIKIINVESENNRTLPSITSLRLITNYDILLKDSYISSIKPSIFTAFLTVLLLIPFQLLFFFFGQDYGYIGQNGLAEVENLVIQELKNNLE